MLVSKPCVHPECPQRQGYIRGYYESVEFIREIKIHKRLRRTRSSVDLQNAAISPTLENDQDGRPRGDERQGDEECDTIIEWVMITRSDPGGSVPRFSE